MDVSIAICCYNSSARIRETLAAIAAQRGCAGICWEVLLIDNASTDGTATVAREAWTLAGGPVPMRVVREEAAGLSNARERARLEAAGAVIAFLDDDNWPNPDWLANVHRIFRDRQEVGVAGGPLEAAFETEPPEWFADFCGFFAVVEYDGVDEGEVERPVCGAGMCIRVAAWQALLKSGFRQVLTDRTGGRLTSGGDFELILGLRNAGWEIRVSEALRIRHFMPAGRLTWSHLEALRRGFGHASVRLEALDNPDRRINRPVEIVKCTTAIARLWPRAFFDNREGNAKRLLLVEQQGRLKALLWGYGQEA